MSEKVVGYLLIALGIMAMIFPLVSVYRVATGSARPVELFNFPGLTLDLSQMAAPDTQDLDPEQQALLQQNRESLKTELVSGEVLSQPLNFIAHLLFMGFIVNLGYKISLIGVNLVRPIKVNLKTANESLKGGEIV
jgi:hypothetical protein